MPYRLLLADSRSLAGHATYRPTYIATGRCRVDAYWQQIGLVQECRSGCPAPNVPTGQDKPSQAKLIGWQRPKYARTALARLRRQSIEFHPAPRLMVSATTPLRVAQASERTCFAVKRLA